ncbi:hypothetical protein ABIA99_002695 [Bradyrhizobium sp. LB12.1]|uniref:hypothetical protein n=1 Tax=Bradyrhizobium sp. LB12.1 TaxID=3156327 RepID=UPI003390E467
MRALMVAIISMSAGSALAQQPEGDVFPPKVNGIEYRLSYGQTVRPGWRDGLKYSDQTKAECERRLALMAGPVVCMVREQLEI